MNSAAPKLRFPEFKDPWKPGHAGDAFKNSRARGAAGLPIYSVTMDRGLVRRDSLDRHMAADAADGQNLRAQPGEVVYNMMRMWQGAVGLAPEECMVSPAYVVLSPRKQTSPQFFDQWFKAKRMLYLLGAYSHGITSDRLRLYADDFARIPLNLPSLPEQQKMAAFLGAVDAKLAALAAQKAALAQFKAGLMQKLFSQQLRFTREDGTVFPDWERKRLGSFIEVINGLTYSPNDVSDTGLLVLRSSNVKDAALALDDNVYVNLAVSDEKMTQPGDILLCVRNGSQRLIGKSALIPKDVPRATHGAFMSVLRGAENRFVFQLLQTHQFFSEVHKNLGATINSINGSDLKKFKFVLPADPEERTRIADALSALDAKIQVVADQTAKLQTFKKGLLQQMFV